MDATTSDVEKLAMDSSPSQLSFEDSFILDCDWYIQLKVTFPDHYTTATDLEANLNRILKEFGDFWHGLKNGLGLEEGEMWPTALVDTVSKGVFFLIGIPRLGSKEIGSVRLRLKDWVKVFGGRGRKGEWVGLEVEGRVMSRKVVSECGFEVYRQEKCGGGTEMGLEMEVKGKVDEEEKERGERKSKTEKKGGGGFPAAGDFKKVEGSNPAEVRRQFLEHSMKNSAASSSSAPAGNTTGKLRPGKDVLNRMKFDERYDIGEFVVGYIDRKEGILEAIVGEWERFGREEVMAYVKNTKSGEIVWDKARRVDLVFGGKGKRGG